MTKHIPPILAHPPRRASLLWRLCPGDRRATIIVGQHMSNAFQRELAFLGLASSPAFVRAPKAMAVRNA